MTHPKNRKGCQRSRIIRLLLNSGLPAPHRPSARDYENARLLYLIESKSLSHSKIVQTCARCYLKLDPRGGNLRMNACIGKKQRLDMSANTSTDSNTLKCSSIWMSIKFRHLLPLGCCLHSPAHGFLPIGSIINFRNRDLY